MHKLATLIFTHLCAALLLIGCSSNQPKADDAAGENTVTIEPETCGAVPNLHRAGDLYFSGQPSVEDLALLKERGIKSVINLRKPQETDLDEQKAVESLGMVYVHVPWNGPDELTDERLDEMRVALREAARPLLLHCGSANRVGPGWIAYRVLDEGASIEQAVAEAKTIGMRTEAYEKIAVDYVNRHQPPVTSD